MAPVGAGVILTIQASPTRIQVNETSEITVSAVLPSGVPVRAGTEIRLHTTLGSIQELLRTDSAGVVRATLQADDRSGKATVRALSGAVGAGQTAIQVEVTIDPAPAVSRSGDGRRKDTMGLRSARAR